ncbi:four helix bundle protein [Pedobacter sp. Leaf176]|uniref:four helix bundle protein n=1 Tax=Pedobacter sp. Leaf176 TaxID=1736286 RepID=UPI0006F4A861|nr:four helix bundle protein [Pedobacter sp. Leaf176]KQR72697.1 four helix bundle protein [Pedobacter sp. Leaf176]
MKNKLEVWKKSHDLILSIYSVTKQFPKEELFGLTSQIRRSAASIPTNIIEGQARQYVKEFKQFLFIAKGSLAETQYHLFLAKNLNYMNDQNYDIINTQIISIKMMLAKLISALSR